jgi:hypothetical protein
VAIFTLIQKLYLYISAVLCGHIHSNPGTIITFAPQIQLPLWSTELKKIQWGK